MIVVKSLLLTSGLVGFSPENLGNFIYIWLAYDDWYLWRLNTVNVNAWRLLCLSTMIVIQSLLFTNDLLASQLFYGIICCEWGNGSVCMNDDYNETLLLAGGLVSLSIIWCCDLLWMSEGSRLKYNCFVECGGQVGFSIIWCWALLWMGGSLCFNFQLWL